MLKGVFFLWQSFPRGFFLCPSLSLLVIVSRKDRKEEKKGRGKEGRDVKREEGRDVKSGSLVLLSLPPTVVYFPPSSLTLFVFERERKEERAYGCWIKVCCCECSGSVRCVVRNVERVFLILERLRSEHVCVSKRECGIGCCCCCSCSCFFHFFSFHTFVRNRSNACSSVKIRNREKERERKRERGVCSLKYKEREGFFSLFLLAPSSLS